MMTALEQRFRPLNAREMVKPIYIGEKYEYRVSIQNAEEITV